MHRYSWLSYKNYEDKDIRKQTQVSLYQSLSERLSEMTEFYHYLLLTPHTVGKTLQEKQLKVSAEKNSSESQGNSNYKNLILSRDNSYFQAPSSAGEAVRAV